MSPSTKHKATFIPPWSVSPRHVHVNAVNAGASHGAGASLSSPPSLLQRSWNQQVNFGLHDFSAPPFQPPVRPIAISSLLNSPTNGNDGSETSTPGTANTNSPPRSAYTIPSFASPQGLEASMKPCFCSHMNPHTQAYHFDTSDPRALSSNSLTPPAHIAYPELIPEWLSWESGRSVNMSMSAGEMEVGKDPAPCWLHEGNDAGLSVGSADGSVSGTSWPCTISDGSGDPQASSETTTGTGLTRPNAWSASTGIFMAPEAPMAPSPPPTEEIKPMNCGLDIGPENTKQVGPDPPQPANTKSIRIINHRKVRKRRHDFELRLQRGDTESWTCEETLFRDFPKMVSDYWVSRGGREKACGGFWKINKVYDERKEGRNVFLEVDWIGTTERGWESEAYVRKNGPGALNEWEEKKREARSNTNVQESAGGKQAFSSDEENLR